VLFATSLSDEFATGFGMAAAAIAVGGFLAHSVPALAGAGEKRIRFATVVGGLVGFALAAAVVVLSVLMG
jgi:hypothetical protein